MTVQELYRKILGIEHDLADIAEAVEEHLDNPAGADRHKRAVSAIKKLLAEAKEAVLVAALSE